MVGQQDALFFLSEGTNEGRLLGDLNWTADVPEARGLPSTMTMPSWWDAGAAGATHSLTFKWVE